MKQLLMTLLIVSCVHVVCLGQYTFKAIIKDAKSKEALIGSTAIIKGTTIGASADANGFIRLENIPTGKQTLKFSFIGYQSISDTFSFPLSSETTITIYLQPNEEELEEVIVSSTRTGRNIDDVPTRIEAIGLEEIDEKSNMRPTNVSMLLHESTGIQVQQTSATSANQSIRIQGLDGKYTQIVKDGFPTFGGFSGGLSLLEIPPLDLKQVEVIKGPASTLYGGGAIAGVVNFVSKTPQVTPENRIILNQTSAGGSDIGAFFSRKYTHWGYTLLANGNLQQPYDVNKDDFTELPKTMIVSILPKLFYYFNDSTSISIGNQTTLQNRTGGDIQVINNLQDSSHTYFEKNSSKRNITFLTYEQRLSNNRRLTVKQSLSYFNRSIQLPSYLFAGKQYNAFTDLTYLFQKAKHTFITGANFYYDRFIENTVINNNDRSSTQNTIGLYLQDSWDANERLKFENGFRVDYSSQYGIYYLPRTSAMYKLNDKLSSRLGAGVGYKTPTVFTEKTETDAYQNVLPISKGIKSEQSIGGTFDLNYKTPIVGDLFLTINQLFFYTYIDRPLVLQYNAINSTYSFANATEPVVSRGFETNAKLVYNAFKLFIGYTYTDAEGRYQQNNIHLALIPRNKINLTLLYERPDNIKIGFETYFSDHQYLSTGAVTPQFWEMGLMAEKTWGHFSFFANFENFTDVRQSRFGPTVLGTHTAPSFPEIYTHTEGFIANAGLKIKW